MLVVFEGCDRSGKSTQIQLVTAYLRKKGYGDRLVTGQYPNRESTTGKLLDVMLRDLNENVSTENPHLMHLLFSANRWESQARLQAAEAAGKMILLDRYVASGIAFSMAKVPTDLQLLCYINFNDTMYLILGLAKRMVRSERTRPFNATKNLFLCYSAAGSL
jgi:dTMP kinase